MRRSDDLVAGEQRVILWRRLLLEYIEGRSGDLSTLDRCQQVALRDDPAARGIHDQHTLLHLGEGLCVDQVARLLGEGHVDGDHIGTRKELIERHHLDPEPLRRLLGDQRVVGDHTHAQAARAVRDDRADVSEAHDAEHLLVELLATEERLLPAASAQALCGLRNPSRERGHERDGVLRRRDRVPLGRIHHDHAARRGARQVDIIDPDSRAANHSQSGSALEEIAGHLGTAADDQALVHRQDVRELGCVDPGSVIHLELAGLRQDL